MLINKIVGAFNNIHNLLNIIEGVEQGSVILQNDSHAIHVQTRRAPDEVWLQLANSESIPVCQGNLDKVSYTVVADGFILYADVASEVLSVNWLAILQNPP